MFKVYITPKQKQKLILAGGVFIVIALALIISSAFNKPKERKKTETASEKRKMSVLTEKVEKDLWVAAESHNIKSLEQSNALLKAELDKMQAELKELKDKQTALEANRQTGQEKGDASNAKKEKGGRKANFPDGTPPPPFPTFPTDAPTPDSADNKKAKEENASPAPGQRPHRGVSSKQGQPVQSIKIFTEEKKDDKDKKNDRRKDDKKKKTVWLPSGSFMKAVLLSGIDAPTSGGSPSEPYPVLMSITDLSVLPNLHRMDITNCFIIGAGYGNISDERAYIRTETLSCVKKNGKAIDISLKGHIIGEDGKLGMRGRVVSKQGQQIAMSIFAGTLGGLGQALRPQQAISVNVDPNNKAGAVQPAFGDIMEGAVMGGAGNALNKVADHYLKMAEKMFPVIEIDAGREVEVMIIKGQALNVQE